MNFFDSARIPRRHQPRPNHQVIMPEVYSWLFPPVRQVVTEFMDNYPMERFLENIHPGLDDAHESFLSAFINHHPEIIGLNDYTHSYPLSGSSEGIFHFITACVSQEPQAPLYVLEHEYKGYEAFVNSVGGSVTVLSEEQALAAPPGILFLSQPSARDGAIIPSEVLRALADQHRVFLDLAYVGLAPRFDLDLTHPNIVAVSMSLSKPFGLYYYRIGAMWTRSPVSSLYGNRWFKNLHGLLLGEHVLNRFQGSMYDYAKSRQQQSLRYLSNKYQVEFEAADIALLATLGIAALPSHLTDELKNFRRGQAYRICLTPLMMALEGDAR